MDQENLNRQPRATPEMTERFQSLQEFVPVARARLNPHIWNYLVGATETETSARRNRLAIDTLALKPRMLRDVTNIDISANFAGVDISLPLILAPIGSLQSFDPEGGAASARAAARSGVVSALSSVSEPGLEATAAAADGPKIYQLYVRGDSDWIDDHADRAVEAGYTAFCLTVDTALYSRRERDIVNRFVKPWRVQAGGREYQRALNWGDVERFKEKHDIPLLIKGIMTPEDAETAVELGVDGIWVSNHGGRQLDHTEGTSAVLPQIVDAVGDAAGIIVDGGFWRGTDVIKALAMGADAVAVGRFTGMALGAAGEEGLVRAIDLLAEEVETALGLMGMTKLSQLSPACLTPAPSVREPHVLSAFPLLDKDMKP